MKIKATTKQMATEGVNEMKERDARKNISIFFYIPESMSGDAVVRKQHGKNATSKIC